MRSPRAHASARGAEARLVTRVIAGKAVTGPAHEELVAASDVPGSYRPVAHPYRSWVEVSRATRSREFQRALRDAVGPGGGSGARW